MVHTLVPSDRVEAAAVYGRDGEKIGTIERLMLEKKAGTVAYAVVKCSGFLKGDTHHYPRGAARDVVGIWRGAISGNMKVSFQAARSIGDRWALWRASASHRSCAC